MNFLPLLAIFALIIIGLIYSSVTGQTQYARPVPTPRSTPEYDAPKHCIHWYKVISIMWPFIVAPISYAIISATNNEFVQIIASLTGGAAVFCGVIYGLMSLAIILKKTP